MHNAGGGWTRHATRIQRAYASNGKLWLGPLQGLAIHHAVGGIVFRAMRASPPQQGAIVPGKATQSANMSNIRRPPYHTDYCTSATQLPGPWSSRHIACAGLPATVDASTPRFLG